MRFSNNFAMKLTEMAPSTLKVVGKSTNDIRANGDILHLGPLDTELRDWKVMHDSLG